MYVCKVAYIYYYGVCVCVISICPKQIFYRDFVFSVLYQLYVDIRAVELVYWDYPPTKYLLWYGPGETASKP